MTAVTCMTCPHRCRLEEGALGACRARRNVGGEVVPEAYGRVTSLAVDPVEKKPLAAWRRGSTVLSMGGYGCNLRCPYCQNWAIAQVGPDASIWREVSPEELVGLAARLGTEDPQMVGIAYTYNEPLVCWEYVRDCACLARERGLANVLVSNGCADGDVVDEVAPLIDAANIDLKAFTSEGYRRLGGSLGTVQSTIRRLAAEPGCHLEVTTLVVPGMSDDEGQVEALARWLSAVDDGIVLHLTRFFPHWRMSDASPTPVPTVRRLADLARRWLPDVRLGNC